MSFFNGVNAKELRDASDGFKSFCVGENEAFIDDAQETCSKNSGKKMMVVTFKKSDGAEIKHYIVDNEYKLANLKQLYTAFGIPLDSVDVADWLHKRGVVVCKEDVHEGKTYPKVSYLKPLGNQPDKSAAKGSQGPRQPQGEPDSFADDIPF